MDNQPGAMRELALFAGAGGGILGGKLLGWKTVCAVEWEPYAAAVLCARQNDGLLAPFPIWDDVQTFDGLPWRGLVDVVSGGFPCQDISSAGKGAGIEGERSGMWKHMARIIGEVRPRYAFIENSPMLIHRGLDVVLCDLAEMGYDAEWSCISAADCGAPHERDRIWVVARDANCNNESDGPINAETPWMSGVADVSDSMRVRQQGQGRPINACNIQAYTEREAGNAVYDSGWPAEPNIPRVANGVAYRMDRLAAIGNGQVPRVAARAFEILSSR